MLFILSWKWTLILVTTMAFGECPSQTASVLQAPSSVLCKYTAAVHWQNCIQVHMYSRFISSCMRSTHVELHISSSTYNYNNYGDVWNNSSPPFLTAMPNTPFGGGWRLVVSVTVYLDIRLTHRNYQSS